jgi:hypothetical protein
MHHRSFSLQYAMCPRNVLPHVCMRSESHRLSTVAGGTFVQRRARQAESVSPIRAAGSPGRRQQALGRNHFLFAFLLFLLTAWASLSGTAQAADVGPGEGDDAHEDCLAYGCSEEACPCTNPWTTCNTVAGECSIAGCKGECVLDGAFAQLEGMACERCKTCSTSTPVMQERSPRRPPTRIDRLLLLASSRRHSGPP